MSAPAENHNNNNNCLPERKLDQHVVDDDIAGY